MEVLHPVRLHHPADLPVSLGHPEPFAVGFPVGVSLGVSVGSGDRCVFGDD
ncbi:hypothetical protein JOL79_16920 [Microbispora sp. RL4-1S]|uniref:Uncharacterized protein n=1 Tax=Microbispora oryzae TaxID=2806554 RepID=A0A940WH90_9ACTN|nr:hypothetical protein [Microbispora oryzae]MBP2705496.1 hypothetical protein [Microbispora oryzae]